MQFLYSNRLITCLFFLFFVQFVNAQNRISEKVIQNLPEIQNTTLHTPLEITTTDELKSQIPDEVLSLKQFFQIQSQPFQSIKNNNSEHLRMTIPVEGEDLELQLVKAEIFTDDFSAIAMSNPDVELEMDRGVHYWGTVKDADKSLATISFFDNEITGLINLNGAQYTLGKVKNSDYHILYKNSDLNHTFDFSCEAIPVNDADIIVDTTPVEKSMMNCVRIHVEADYSLYQNRGSSVANTTNYINGVFAEVATLYTNESINIQISYLRVWDTPSPYGNGSELSDLTGQGFGRTFGDLVHIVHTNGGGGVAYLDVLCSQTNNTGASGVYGSYNSVPSYSWDVEVITHELGHNLGSPHTHACAWNGNNTAIDGCGPAAGYDEGCDPGLPASGTIMSYCHLVGGVGINFNLGFGQQPGDLIRSRVNNASCLSACGPATCNDGYQNGNETGIDCGGPDCIACPTCVDGIQNGNETGIDCGGPDCAACACASGAGISLIMNPDYYTNETTWTVTNASGATVASGGPYGQGLAFIYEPLCLPEGCYDFTIFDSYGDGLFDGNTTGTYVLVDEGNNLLVSGAGDFGAQETTNFCVAPLCANMDLDITFDANSDQTSWEILDASGNAVASGGNYSNPAGSSQSEVACLPDGCYDLVFYDSGNDGMCPRRTTTVLTGINVAGLGLGGVFNGIPRVGSNCGDYTLTDANGATLASGGGRFGSSETNNFCISGGVAQLNYQPNDVYALQNTVDNNALNMWITPTLTSNDITVFTTLDEMDHAQINVVDINGKIMQQHVQSSNSTNELQLNVSDFPAGIYFVQMVANDTVLVEKFVKR